MNSKEIMNQHLGNLSRLAGHPVTKYEYMISRNDFARAWAEAHSDLGYPLLKESMRDRFLITNKAGLEKKVNEVITELIVNSEKLLIDMLKEDATYAVQDVINSIDIKNNSFVIGTLATHTSSYASKVGKFLGKAIGQAAGKIVDIMTKEIT